MSRRTTGAGIVTGGTALALLAAASPAHAGLGDGQGGTVQEKKPTPKSGGGDTVGMHVSVRGNAPASGTPMTPVGTTDWEPPACWYEPMWKPKAYKKALQSENPTPQVLGDYAEEYQTHQKKREKQDYNIGKKGLWWSLHHEAGSDDAACLAKERETWVPEGGPPTDPAALSPELLSKIAYANTRLPTPPVKLSPADAQVVNLDTQVSFKAPLERVWVTASIDHLGVDIAATTVATPKALTVKAGTEHAEPKTCTYGLSKARGGYQVESTGADCNIIYKRSPGKGGTYPFSASLVWDVTWTDSADPDGPPVDEPALPDGQSTYEQDVTVKEIQSIVRA